MFNDGKMNSDFIGGEIGPEGEIYDVMQNTIYASAKVHDFDFPKYKDFNTFSEQLSKEAELLDEFRDYVNDSTSESHIESFMVYLKDGSQKRADDVRERDSIINSKEGTNKWYKY